MTASPVARSLCTLTDGTADRLSTGGGGGGGAGPPIPTPGGGGPAAPATVSTQPDATMARRKERSGGRRRDLDRDDASGASLSVADSGPRSLAPSSDFVADFSAFGTGSTSDVPAQAASAPAIRTVRLGTRACRHRALWWA